MQICHAYDYLYRIETYCIMSEPKCQDLAPGTRLMTPVQSWDKMRTVLSMISQAVLPLCFLGLGRVVAPQGLRAGALDPVITHGLSKASCCLRQCYCK